MQVDFCQCISDIMLPWNPLNDEHLFSVQRIAKAFDSWMELVVASFMQRGDGCTQAEGVHGEAGRKCVLRAKDVDEAIACVDRAIGGVFFCQYLGTD